MRIAALRGVKNFVIESQPIPKLGSNEVLVRVKACGVCTSDTYTWSGKIEVTDFPRYIGHEPSGVVERIGECVTSVNVNDHVTVWTEGGGYAEYVKVPEDYVVKIPKELRFEEALGEPIACMVNGVRRSRIKLGDTVVVIGCGFMGSLFIQGTVLRGASKIVAIDLLDERLELARKLGADITINSGEEDAVKMVMEITGGKGADVVVEATGEQRPLDIATEVVKIRGTLVVFGYHVGGRRSVDMASWNWKGLDIVSAHERDPKIYVEGMRAGIALLSKGRLKMNGLITHLYPLDQINDAFMDATEHRPRGFMKAVITP
ncbi:MAG: zinc-binding dehydrogenase [Thermoproteota archaeon]|nr:zinc-binding dehydrogenase [Candidatus Brockarchaeota archaeon]